ncbi:hypothetical protein C8J57DRAFT_1712629 [Mycena rebaudengoi]|nr:hypothetical protein C8J57DRAFT_1712629 [Mycena rebaudengoi]
MPIYTLNTRGPIDRDTKKSFVKALTALHVQTFHSDPAAVRVEFLLAEGETRYGGYGFKPKKGLLGYGLDSATAHLVAQVVWNGSAEEWQEYCRKIVKLWGPQLRTVVLQRVEWEFEVEEQGGLGRIVGNDNAGQALIACLSSWYSGCWNYYSPRDGFILGYPEEGIDRGKALDAALGRYCPLGAWRLQEPYPSLIVLNGQMLRLFDGLWRSCGIRDGSYASLPHLPSSYFPSLTMLHPEPSENWDDDFEFNHKNTRRHQDQDQEPPRPPRDSHETTENWDDDFEEDEPRAPSPLPRPPSAPSKNRTPRANRARTRSGSGSTARQQTAGGWDSSEDDDELGFAHNDTEDHTITARSASASSAGSRRLLSYSNHGSPPPPVPPLPSGVVPISIPSGGSTSALGLQQPQPFPRSPTASVFSHPDNASIAYTHTSAGSTTHLTRPHGSRGLAGLPPSPPLHRERERKSRRLRKKSRPGGAPATGLEMREMPLRTAHVQTSSEEAGMAEEEEDWDAEEVGASGSGSGSGSGHGGGGVAGLPPAGMPPYAAPPHTNATASGSNVAIGSPGLLQRIGSVKKWGLSGLGAAARRKKGSSVSVGSDFAFDTDLDAIPDIHAHANGDLANEATPRPPSAASLMRTGSQSSSRSRHSYAHPPPQTPPPKPAAQRYSNYTPRTPQQETPPAHPQRSSGSNWFFRGASSSSGASASSGSPGTGEQQQQRGRFRGGAGNGNGGGGGGVGRDGAVAGGAADVSGGEARPYTPTPLGGRDEKDKDKGDGKTKLVKRRSLGFVQIRKGIRPLNGNAPEGKLDEQTTATPNPSPSKNYAGIGVGRPPTSAAQGSVEDLGRVLSGGKEREGMGFVERNVRRISLVGAHRHRRNKSGVSISGLSTSGMAQSGDEKENDDKGKTGASGLSSTKPAEPLLPQPPVDVQVQSPSPPQTVRSSSASTAKMSAPINIAAARNLELMPTAFSPTFSLSSSATTPASSSSPSLTPYSAPSSPPHSSSPSPKPPVSPHSASLGRSAAISPVVSGASPSPGGAAASGTMRRNSLGDLKIPARISQAQVGLRRDLGMVREFARNVEELKELQDTYQTLVSEVQGILDNHVLHPPAKEPEPGPSRVSSPTFFKRHRSNTSSSNPGAPSSPVVQTQAASQQQAYKQLASAFYTINSKYRISWECAELLIELGGGGSSASPPSTSTSAPTMSGGGGSGSGSGAGAGSGGVGGSDGLRSGKNKARERAITLQGDDVKGPPSPVALTSAASTGAIPGPPLASPPSNLAWRASTGRNDLSQRQLLLLKEMLGSPGPDDSFGGEDIPEEALAAVAGSSNTVNRDWRWGDPMNSTVTLPSEESAGQGGAAAKQKKRRSSRLRMSGIRDMLRSLKKGGATPPVPVSSTSISTGTESSTDVNAAVQQQHLYEHRQVPTNGKRRRAKTSAGPESLRSTISPFEPASLKTASPRRPSLASIFRLGKSRTTPPPSAAADVSLDAPLEGAKLYPTFSGISGGRESQSTSEEEDWDRMEDSPSDAEAAAAIARRGGSTIRGRSPYMHASFLTPAQTGRPTTPMRSPSGSRTSILIDPSAPPRGTRLSNVEEHVDLRSVSMAGSPSRKLSRSRRGGKTGSVRSMPPVTLPDPKLAMTPENIRPLLENAKEVHARLSDCIGEIRALLAARP